ncbi:MAG: hypothetical protein IJ613_04005, partial [Muribaculaceae bacterium]|nr:hypothetical protein [Muribaculaceae bacterium]
MADNYIDKQMQDYEARQARKAKAQSGRSGSESFGFRSLSSHTTVRAVRHTAVWLVFRGVFSGHL